jgi:hypothetical protein
VDPWFDLFRQLLPDEAPPTLGKLLGSEQALFVLPAEASEEMRAGYRRLAEQWAKGYRDASIVLDRDLKALPKQTPSWLLGWENSFTDRFLGQFEGSRFSRVKDGLQVAGNRFPAAGHSLAMVNAEPGSGRISALIASDDPQALAGLTRKLPHYGKYSYLVFAGTRPDNQLKGQWTVTESPLRIYLSELRPEIQPLQPTPLWPLAATKQEPGTQRPSH